VSALWAYVFGMPRPQGSVRMMPVASGGIVAKASEGLAVWRNDVVTALLRTREERGWETVAGAVFVDLGFYFPRPKSHSVKRRTTDGGWKDDGPDLDKLCRAVLDALEAAGVIANDRQVTELQAVKRYAIEPMLPGCLLHVSTSRDDAPLSWRRAGVDRESIPDVTSPRP
jgi:crossover junction endodeoxyribonuclease RusA